MSKRKPSVYIAELPHGTIPSNIDFNSPDYHPRQHMDRPTVTVLAGSIMLAAKAVESRYGVDAHSIVAAPANVTRAVRAMVDGNIVNEPL